MNSDEKLDDLVKKSIDEFLSRNPAFATQLGAHEYDDKLDDMSPEFLEEMIQLLKDTQEELDKIEKSGHSEIGLIDREVFRSSIDLFLFQLEEMVDQEKNPDFGGFVGGALFPLFMRDFAPIEERMRCIASRLEQVPRAFEQFKSLVTHPVKLWTQLAIQSVQGIPGLIQLIISVSEAQVSKELHERLKKAGAVATKTLEETKVWLEELLLTAHDEWALGPERFEQLLQLRKIPLKSSEILELGESYLRKFKQELAELTEIISPGSSTEQIREQLQDNHPSTFDEVLETYRQWVAKAQRWVIDNDFATVLDGELRVVETPGYLKPLIPTAALILPSIFDETKFGEYIVTNLDDEENLRRHYMAGIPRTCVHEAYPGHFLQNIGKANAPLSRLLHSELTLVEGWAFYCEQATIDLGFNDTSEARFSQTLALIWRAARIIIDIKLSRGEMTFDEAVQMLMAEAGMDENRAKAEVSRYTMTPGYPLSYLLGRHLIMEARRNLEEEFGPEFNLKLFHDTIINAGSIPVSFIPQLYRASIK
ncbi:MAG: DUF885 domain-containing protein [Candidatus Thorarchaeota archaeon]|nr:DUF885 domain-containing protein [Candidatus Thorarchaeota archaeon]